MSLNTDWEYYGAVDRFLKVTAEYAPIETWRCDLEYLRTTLAFLVYVKIHDWADCLMHTTGLLQGNSFRGRATGVLKLTSG